MIELFNLSSNNFKEALRNSLLIRASITNLNAFLTMINLIFTLITMNSINAEILFNFNDLNEDQIVVVNDSVMGGRSSSKYTFTGKTVTFTGEVSLKNNGGFASLRMIWPFEKANNNRIQLKLIGDGKAYQFRLRTNRGFDGAAYVYQFNTIKDKLITIEMDIDQFVPSFRGRKLTNMPKLNLTDVRQMGLLIADKQTGEFEIQIESISLLNQ